MSQKQHKAVYNVPGPDGKLHRIEVNAPLGMSEEEIKKSVADFLRLHPNAQLLSRTWSSLDL